MDTKEKIQEEFILEYSRKEYARITVKDLCINVPVARTTFYSYYQNTDELLEEIEDRLIRGLRKVAADVSGGNLSDMDFDRFQKETLVYVRKNWSAFCALLTIQPDRRFEKKLKDAIKLHFKMRYPEKSITDNYELITEMMASAVLGGYCFWLQNPDKLQETRFRRVITQTLDQFVRILR